MALDPTIPLGVRPMGPQQQINPMEMMGQWTQIQNALNQNRLFQQTFAARQRAGQIMSSAPNMEAALEGLLKDPLTAPFAGETINSMRQAQLTMTQMQGAVQTQSQSGLEGFMKMLPGVFADPSEDTWNNNAQAVLETLSPQARAKVGPAIDSLRKSLLSGLPEDPEAAKAVFTQRLSGMMLASGFTADGIKAIAGTPGQLDVGGAVQPTVQDPIQLGGQTRPVGQAFPKSLPPGTAQFPGGVPGAIGGGVNPMIPGMGQIQPPSGGAQNGLGGFAPGLSQMTPVPGRPGEMTGPNLDPQMEVDGPPTHDDEIYMNPDKFQQNPLQMKPSKQLIPSIRTAPQPRGVPPAGQTGDAAGPSIPDEPASYTGKPLFQGMAAVAPKVGVGMAGMNILSPSQQKSAEKQMDSFQGDELHAYQNNVNSLGALDRMDHAMESMAKAGGILTPGAFGNTRLEIAKSLNLMGDTLGFWDSSKPRSADNNPWVDPEAIASAEDLRKEATRAGMLFLSQTLGAQREAASVIYSTIQAVPGLDNTLLGGRLVSRSLRAAAHREIDKRKFQEEWSSRTQGDLTGSLTAFNKLHPGDAYFKQVLDSMGFSPEGDGFKSPQAIQQAFRSGYMSREEAAAALADQFPDQFKAR